jgi:4-hydroxy-tetrahydrodipicolinate synthase
VDTDVLVRLHREVPTMVGVKDAAGNPAASARLVAEAGEGFDLYSGDDAFTLPFLAIGGTGVIGVAAHWSAAEHAEMITAHQKGDVETAKAINARLLDSYDYETWNGTPQAVTTKALLRELDLPVGRNRPPIGPDPDGIQIAARAVLEGLHRS